MFKQLHCSFIQNWMFKCLDPSWPNILVWLGRSSWSVPSLNVPTARVFLLKVSSQNSKRLGIVLLVSSKLLNSLFTMNSLFSDLTILNYIFSTPCNGKKLNIINHWHSFNTVFAPFSLGKAECKSNAVAYDKISFLIIVRLCTEFFIFFIQAICNLHKDFLATKRKMQIWYSFCK